MFLALLLRKTPVNVAQTEQTPFKKKKKNKGPGPSHGFQPKIQRTQKTKGPKPIE